MKEVLELKTKEKIIIRHLKKIDVESIWINFNNVVKEGLFIPVFTPVLSEFEKNSWYETVKSDKEVCVVADAQKLSPPYNIIGQCEISNVEWEASKHVGVLGIIINKDYRDLGVGKKLIDLAIRESKILNNKEKIVLSCFSSNERGIHLYKKLGFEVVGVRKRQFYMDSSYQDEILMELWIEDYLKTNAEI